MHLIPENLHVSSGNEPNVIHVVRRMNGVNGQGDAPERPLEPDRCSIEQSSHTLDANLQALRSNETPMLQSSLISNPSIHIPNDGRYSMQAMAGSEENHRLAETVRQSPMAAETNMTSSSPFSLSWADEHAISPTPITTSHRPSRISCDSSSPSPMHDSRFHSQEVAQPLEESHEHTAASIPTLRTLLLPDAAYPEYIHDTLAHTADLPPSRRNFYSLWTYVLEYWFPSTEGFEVVQDWNPNIAFRAQEIMINSELPPKANPSFAVFDSVSPTLPFLFVNIHNGIPVNDLSRVYAKTTLEESFETLRACSFGAGFETLCVVSAVGAKWNMVLRDVGWLEGEAGVDVDHVGAFEEDVTSSESYRVMGYCFEEIKRSVLRRRQEHLTGPCDKSSTLM